MHMHATTNQKGLSRRLRQVLSITLLQAVASVTAFGSDGTPFVNEIHYDNEGSDLGEAVEIAGPAGTDLSGWQLVFYNGGTGTAYRAVLLEGTLADECDGFGVRSFAVSGIQNGAPDGYALVDPSGTVAEFLSYEGTFDATDGPAAGLSSIEMGSSESTSTPVDYSLQRIGMGSSGSEFTWSEPIPETFGSCNTDQSFTSVSIPALIGGVVFEDADGDGYRDGAEPGIRSVVVELTGPDGSTDSDTTSGDGLYAFTGLSAGTYRVEVDSVSLPARARLTGDPDGTDTPGVATVSVAPGEAVYAADFGYRIGDSCAALALPSWDGSVIRDGDHRYLPIRFDAGADELSFYDIENLTVDGVYATDGDSYAPLSDFLASADRLTFTYTGDPARAPDDVYPRVAAPEAGPSSFFLKLTDQCGRTVDVDPILALASDVQPGPGTHVRIFPNPSEGVVSIRVASESGGELRVDVYDVLGRRVRRLSSDFLTPGSTSEVRWHGDDASGARLGAGLYVFRVSVGDDVTIGQVSLLP